LSYLVTGEFSYHKFPLNPLSAKSTQDGSTRPLVVESIHDHLRQVPPPKSAPFDWPVFGIAQGESIQFRWEPGEFTPDSTWIFRITAGVDDREEKTLQLIHPNSGEILGEMDVRYAYACQPFQLELDLRTAATLLQEGVILRLSKGTTPFWGLAPRPAATRAQDDPFLFPHLTPMIESDSVLQLKKRLCSLASIQPFGWMEGCVAESLWHGRNTMAEFQPLEILKNHLGMFFKEDGSLLFENPRSEQVQQLGTIESTLMFASLARLLPEHPQILRAIEFWESRTREDGTVRDRDSITAEGAYTIAYPIAVLGIIRKDSQLVEKALTQLRARVQRLKTSDGMWLRHHTDNSRTFRNWARGIAWYMLGLTRTLETIPAESRPEDLQQEIHQSCHWLISRQREDGLWNCYVDDPEGNSDTSGSAGIATAIAIAARHGWVDSAKIEISHRAWIGLLPHLTHDGFLRGVAQSNKGGEELQRSSYRVISQIGMGLMGQLFSELQPS
jgi:unsaturated rhamnogalacturonyl hydrolase